MEKNNVWVLIIILTFLCQLTVEIQWNCEFVFNNNGLSCVLSDKNFMPDTDFNQVEFDSFSKTQDVLNLTVEFPNLRKFPIELTYQFPNIECSYLTLDFNKLNNFFHFIIFNKVTCLKLSQVDWDNSRPLLKKYYIDTTINFPALQGFDVRGPVDQKTPEHVF